MLDHKGKNRKEAKKQIGFIFQILFVDECQIG
jgi:hypothetical protein